MKIFRVISWGVLFLTVTGLHAQTGNYRITCDNYQNLTIVLTTDEITVEKVTFYGQDFEALTSTGLTASSEVGRPNLPLFSQLIEVPLNQGYKVTVSDMVYDTLQLNHRVIPVQPSRSKSDERRYPLSIDEKIYATDAFYGSIEAFVESVGIARDRQLARLQFAPMQYNPVSGELVVCRQATVNVRYIKPDERATLTLFNTHHSPAFASGAMTLNSLYPKSVANAAPVRYLIVAHSMFRGQLDTFVQWKRRKGFITDIVYTDEAAVGTTTSSIQSYIQSQYTNATAANPAPTYLLLVGDNEQIPAFTGTTNTEHITDLYYISWTSGDNIPDCYCGRFSAQTIAQLTPQIEKTLMYEQYTFSDPSFLDRAVLIAGVDGGNDGDYGYTHADPAMDYAITHYINGARGFSQIMYFKNNTSIVPTGSNVTIGNNASSNSATVRSYYNQGAGWINYSAHGSATSWGTPNFTTDHAAAMTNTQKFGLMIGNCCLTNKFQTSTCLGEAVLRKGNYCGAVGYIGGSNSTYWGEDFYWAVGVRSNISATMSMAYDATHLGAYDRLCHTHNEAYTNWAMTQGDLMFQGNMAVQSSTSSLKLYYWEIYHLMGDPSVMPYLTQAPQMTLAAPSAIVAGSTSLQVTAAPYAYVALTTANDHTLIAATYADGQGSALLTLPVSLAVGNYELTASAQQYRTVFQDIHVILPNGPYVMVTNFTPASSPDAGTTVPASLTVTNLGTSTAYNVVLNGTTNSTTVSLLNSTLTIDSIPVGSMVTLTNALSAHIALSANDGEMVFTYFTSRWDNSNDSVVSTLPLTVKAPQITLSYSVSPVCMHPGEDLNLAISLTNRGHATLPAGQLKLSSPFTLMTATGDSNIFSLPVSEGISQTFSIHADSLMPANAEMPLELFFQTTETRTLDTIKVYLGNNYIETFEGTQLTLNGWSQGSYPWTIIDTTAYQGTRSMRSYANLPANSTSEVTLTHTVTNGGDSISFHYRVSSEQNYDKFHFYIDNQEMLTESGDQDWMRAAFPVSVGTHSFKFTYSKDYSVDKYNDCVWIDDITLTHEVIPVTYLNDTLIACDSYSAGDTVYTSSCTLGEVHGDTLLTLFIIINQSTSDTIQVTAQGESYSWNDTVYTESGTYIQVLQNWEGCDSVITLELTLVTDTTQGIVDQEALIINTYPNPTTGVIYFSQHIDEVQVYDAHGRMIATLRDILSVDLQQQPAGVYLLKLRIKEQTATCRIIRR